jgi:medium-chain acyl-[acyl-carrier-protein] hydrolase
MTKTIDAWFQRAPTTGRVELEIFCFPYAGGSAQVFKKWPKLLPSTAQVVSVELPGRGARMQEPPFASLPDLIDDLEKAVWRTLDKPFVFFGHSMGAIIAFELARALRRKYDREPQALFVSGCKAPQLPRGQPVTYNLPPDEFIDELIKLEGTPKEIIEDSVLMEIMLPLLRADFQIAQTYEYIADAPFRCPIIAYCGLQDHETGSDKLSAWKEQTVSEFSLHMLPGDHFFIRSSQDELLRLLAHKLREFIART